MSSTAHARTVEYRLGQHRSRQQRADVQSHYGDNGDERVSQRVAVLDPPRVHAFGVGGANVVLLQHFQERRADHAHNERGLNES